MSSAVDIQIVSTMNLEKIENFFNDASYRETIEYSASFNSRLCGERRLRLPFFDSQTGGVAQNSSQLFLNKRQRMPGFRQGQIYTYPAARWRKSRRQYLNRMYRFPDRPFQALRKEHEAHMAASLAASGGAATMAVQPTVIGGGGGIGFVGTASTHDVDFNGSAILDESSSLGAAGGDTSDSKDSQHQHLPKEWFYEEMDINDADTLEDPKSPADDEYDYDPRYGSKKRRKRRPSKKAALAMSECGSANRRRSGGGRGRLQSVADTSLSGLDVLDSLSGDATAPPTPTGRRSRANAGSRGRRRAKAAPSAGPCNPPSPAVIAEPPSFESAAAAAANMSDMPSAMDEHGELRNYRKYL